METKFVVWVNGNPSPETGRFSREEAEKEAHRLAGKEGKQVFISESITAVTPENATENAYKNACKYLGIKYTPFLRSDLENIGIIGKYVKAISAFYKLIIIAESWNKKDGFVFDPADYKQEMYFPMFGYTDGPFYENAYYAGFPEYSPYNTLFCFKSEKRATKFGKKFVKLTNDFLLIK